MSIALLRPRVGSVRAAAVLAAILLAGLLAGLVLSYQVRPALEVDLGSTKSLPLIQHFFAPEKNDRETYAFSQQQSRITLPGNGGGATLAVLRLSGERPAGVPEAELQLRAGEVTIPLAPRQQWAVYRLLLPTQGGDVRLMLESNTFQVPGGDPRRLGLPIDRLVSTPLNGQVPLALLGWLAALTLLLLWLALRLQLRGWWALAAAGLPLLALLAGLALARLYLTIAIPRWVAALVLLHLLLWPAQALLRRVLARYELAVDDSTWHSLWRVTAVAFLYKIGGVLYPHIKVFDAPAHVTRMMMIVHGRFMELYQPNPFTVLGNTVGLEGGHLPYSPLWHLLITPFYFLGFNLFDVSNVVNATLDVSKGLLIFVLGLAVFRRALPALLAAALYQLLPMPYYLLSWGNWPTQFGLWGSLLAGTFLVLNYQRLFERAIFWRWVLLLVLAMLTYTVMGIMTFTMLGMLAVVEALRGQQRTRGLIPALLLGMLLAELICFAVYHHQFAGVVLQDTLPAIFQGVQERAETPLETDVDPRESPLANLSANWSFMRNHSTDALLLLSLLAPLALLYRGPEGRWWPLWLCWLGIFVLYSVVSALIADMVLKHILYIMPLMCLWSGVALEYLARRSLPGRVATVLAICAVALVTFDRWLFYLLEKRHF